VAKQGLFFAILGKSKAVANLRIAEKVVLDQFEGTTMKAAKDIMLISKSEFVPIKTGALMASGRVVKLKRGKSFKVEMRYGGPPSYAVAVHEQDLDYRNNREWKYLETPAKEYAYTEAMTTHMRREMAGRIGGLTRAARAGQI
jgi:hypothetical protein